MHKKRSIIFRDCDRMCTVSLIWGCVGGVVSFTMVYSAMEEGAKLVLNGSRSSAASMMSHKYGPDYGKLTDDTMASGAHAVNAYTSFRNVAVRLNILPPLSVPSNTNRSRPKPDHHATSSALAFHARGCRSF